MNKINYMQKKVKVEFDVEGFLGMINRRDNIYIVTRILESNYKNDDMIKEVCRFMKEIGNTFDIIANNVRMEFEQVMIDDNNSSTMDS